MSTPCLPACRVAAARQELARIVRQRRRFWYRRVVLYGGSLRDVRTYLRSVIEAAAERSAGR